MFEKKERTKSKYKLIQGIISLSTSRVWEQAKLEWELAGIERDEFGDTCLCGHYPIKEVCKLANKLNGNTTIVGNVCVNKFIGLPSENLFRSIRKVIKNNRKALHMHIIEDAHKKGWINDPSLNFYANTCLKRKLSEKQMVWRINVNQIILKRLIKKQRPRSPQQPIPPKQ